MATYTQLLMQKKRAATLGGIPTERTGISGGRGGQTIDLGETRRRVETTQREVLGQKLESERLTEQKRLETERTAALGRYEEQERLAEEERQRKIAATKTAELEARPYGGHAWYELSSEGK